MSKVRKGRIQSLAANLILSNDIPYSQGIESDKSAAKKIMIFSGP